MLTRTAIAATCFLVAGTALAEEPLIDRTDDPALRIAINNAHHEMAACVAFYTIGSEGVRRRDPSDQLITTLEQARTKLLTTMLQLHHPDVTQARIAMEFGSQMKRMREDFSNFSLLLLEHAEPCKTIAQDPRGVIERRYLSELAKEQNK